MEESFVHAVHQIFTVKSINGEDSFACDDSLRNNLWCRIENFDVTVWQGQQISENNKLNYALWDFNAEMQLEVFLFPKKDQAQLREALTELANHFYDINQQSYTFKQLPSLTEMFQKYFKVQPNLEHLTFFPGRTLFETVEVYSGMSDALFLCEANDALVAYVFTFFPMSE